MTRFEAQVLVLHLLREGASQQSVLKTLRTQGFSQTESVQAIVDAMQIPVAKAKRLVHESAIWSASREHDDNTFEERR